jgi:hypothetical protein
MGCLRNISVDTCIKDIPKMIIIMLINVAVSGDRNMIKEQTEKILKYKTS